MEQFIAVVGGAACLYGIRKKIVLTVLHLLTKQAAMIMYLIFCLKTVPYSLPPKQE
jgi:hypothetical protein